MGIVENDPFGSQLIHVRRLGLWVALQHAGPVVEIIDGDEQYIRSFGLTPLTLGCGLSGDHGRDEHDRCHRGENAEWFRGSLNHLSWSGGVYRVSGNQTVDKRCESLAKGDFIGLLTRVSPLV